MKKTIMIILFFLTTSSVNASVAYMETKTISVKIENIKTERGGQLIVFVFTSLGFPKQHDHALMKFIELVEHSKVQMEIQVPANQNFSLKVLHDENMDGKVTKNWTGIIPKDGLGFSNGARIRFGPPSFDDAKIRYAEELAPIIPLHYDVFR